MRPGVFPDGFRLCVALLASVRCVHGQASRPVIGLKQEEDLWTTARTSHRFKSLTTEQLKTVAELTDEKLLRSLIDTVMIPRVPGTVGHRKVREFIVETLEGLGWHVEQQSFDNKTPHGVKTFVNVIANEPRPNNCSASTPLRRLSLACHYDSKWFKDFEFYAATDSAVPCAIMLHLAKTLAEPLIRRVPECPDVGLEFVFFDGEEAFVHWSAKDSIYGARHLAETWSSTPFPSTTSATTRLDSLDVLVLLDLLGEAKPKFHKYFVDTARHYDRLANIEKRLSDEEQLSLVCKRCNRYFEGQFVVGSFIEDDHIPFLRRGVPILHLIPHPFPKYWHDRGDDGKNLDYPTIFDLTRIISVFVSEYLHLRI